jgi:hypothetical protein
MATFEADWEVIVKAIEPVRTAYPEAVDYSITGSPVTWETERGNLEWLDQLLSRSRHRWRFHHSFT